MNKVVGKAKLLKQDIDLTNKYLTVLDAGESVHVRLVHETIVYKRYIMDWQQDVHGYRTVIEFNGSVVKITENGFVHMFDATGYMKWKLGVLRRALDNKIKSQNKAYDKAAKKQERAQKRTENVQKMRDALAKFVFDQEKDK